MKSGLRVSQRNAFSEPADLFLQQSAGKVDTALDRTKGLTQRISDLMILVPLKIEHERLLEDFREVVYRRTDILQPEIALGTVIDRGLVVVDQEVVRRAVEDRVLLCLATIIVDENIAHDRIEPGLDVGPYAILVMIGQCPEHRLLKEILRRFLILGERNGKRLQELGILKQQLVELFCGHGFLFMFYMLKLNKIRRTKRFFV